MERDLIADVQRAADLTIQDGTARVVYEIDLRVRQLSAAVDIFSPDHADPPLGRLAHAAWSVAGRGLKAAERGISDLATGRQEGTIDFGTGSCLLTRHWFGRDCATWYEPGRVVQQRRDGTWRSTNRRPFDGSSSWSPMWLVELVRGAVDATIVEPPPGGGSCLDIGVDCDLRLAAERSVHGMSPPFPAGHGRNVHGEVRLDRHGRIDRVKAFLRVGEPDDVVKEWTSGTFELMLRDLGVALAPAPPALD